MELSTWDKILKFIAYFSLLFNFLHVGLWGYFALTIQKFPEAHFKFQEVLAYWLDSNIYSIHHSNHIFDYIFLQGQKGSFLRFSW
ncbi:Uncharacterised protein [Sphingobacterium daejeonense]|nr:Uncharacterised protein [Sphingobacterium daejeonense]